MKIMKFPLAMVAALLLVSTLSAQSMTQPIDGIAAVVEDDVILRSELELAVNNVVAQNAGRQLPPRNVLERQVLEQMILMKLQVERARETGVRVSDAQLEQTVQGVAASNNVPPAELRRRLESEGLSWEAFRTTLREDMMVQQLRQRVVQSRVVVSESEVDLALSVAGEQSGRVYHLANLLVALPDGATPEQISTAQTRIDGVRGLIERGEMDFASAAIRYSDAPNALQGGDLEWRSLDEIPSSFASIVTGMSPGEVSQPIRGPSGFQLLQLIESRDQDAQRMTEYNARGIVVRTSEVVSAEQARRRIEELRQRIVDGEDFAALAREHSDDTTNRALGGDMGWFQLNAWGGGVAAQLQRLDDGELSPPFQTEFGWHLVERLGTREVDVTEANQRNRARELIGRRKSDEELERFVRQLRSEAFVDVRLEG